MTIKVMGLKGNTYNTFDDVTDYDLTKYPIIELTSEAYKSRVVMQVPISCYVAVTMDESEEQNES